MKDVLTDANFPRTADQRVYHLGLRPGEVANRIITVGSPSRAEAIAAHLDAAPPPFRLASERGFLTITGRFRGAPVSVVSIGMGAANMDFFVREARECLAGDMVVVRLGSCGALIDVPVGAVVVPAASVAVTRDVDFDFARGAPGALPYRISKPAPADPALHEQLLRALQDARPAPASDAPVVGGAVNASADSFYSSQGRQTSFPDHNARLIAHLRAAVPGVATLEMETFHLLHLAACWNRPADAAPRAGTGADTGAEADADAGTDAAADTGTSTPDAPPLATGPVTPSIAPAAPFFAAPIAPAPAAPLPAQPLAARATAIRAAAAHLVFASRTSQAFITPDAVAALEAWTGRGVLAALAGFAIAPDRLHADAGSVWELR